MQVSQLSINPIPWLFVLILSVAHLLLIRRYNQIMDQCQEYVDEQYSRMCQRERRLRWYLNQEATKRYRAQRRLKERNERHFL